MPSQCSTIAAPYLRSSQHSRVITLPTAHASVADSAAMSLSSAIALNVTRLPWAVVVIGLGSAIAGTGTRVQADPFQCSVAGCARVPNTWSAVAHTSFAAVAASCPTGTGVATVRHAVPFQWISRYAGTLAAYL